jgi:hypothetical protein
MLAADMTAEGSSDIPLTTQVTRFINKHCRRLLAGMQKEVF